MQTPLWARQRDCGLKPPSAKKVEDLVAGLPRRQNDYQSGVLLQGKFATINLHPAIKETFKGLQFNLRPSTSHMVSWSNAEGPYVARPVAGFAGKPLSSEDEAIGRIPYRHPEHDAISYINSGVDELQVYYAITVLMESLAEMGFTDKELSEKPFHAFFLTPYILWTLS